MVEVSVRGQSGLLLLDDKEETTASQLSMLLNFYNLYQS